MTAVEWLHEKLAKSTQEELVGNINTYFKQAKELEKQQIIDFAEKYILENLTCNYNGEPISLKEAEQYYNETFKNK